MCLRCVKEFWFGRNLHVRWGAKKFVAPHMSGFKTRSMINAVHNEKQLRDALNK